MNKKIAYDVELLGKKKQIKNNKNPKENISKDLE